MPLALVVDDESQLRALLRSILEMGGWSVVDLPHGPAALELAARGGPAPGLAIVDLGMPHMPGDAVVEALQNIWPDLPCILTTGDPHAAARMRVALQGRAIVVLAKPFGVTELERVVASLVARAGTAP